MVEIIIEHEQEKSACVLWAKRQNIGFYHIISSISLLAFFVCLFVYLVGFVRLFQKLFVPLYMKFGLYNDNVIAFG